jgi:molecular chaperone HtpG
LWTRPRTEITDEEYKEFYRHVAHDFAEPAGLEPQQGRGQARVHLAAVHAGARRSTCGPARCARGLKLYVRRVFIMDDAEQFLPLYLRFVKGVLDSNDLPLNVSRELLQNMPEVEAMRVALTQARARPAREAGQGRAGEVPVLLEGIRRRS